MQHSKLWAVLALGANGSENLLLPFFIIATRSAVHQNPALEGAGHGGGNCSLLSGKISGYEDW